MREPVNQTFFVSIYMFADELGNYIKLRPFISAGVFNLVIGILSPAFVLLCNRLPLGWNQCNYLCSVILKHTKRKMLELWWCNSRARSPIDCGYSIFTVYRHDGRRVLRPWSYVLVSSFFSCVLCGCVCVRLCPLFLQ